MTTSIRTWRVPPWAYIPLGAAIIAEAVSNALRAYGLGQHLEHFTVAVYGRPVSLAGSVLVLAAVAISLSQARAAWVALTPNPVRQRIVAGIAAALLLAVSVSAMASQILEAQRAKVADEGGVRSSYDRADAAYKRAAAELEALGNPRPVAVIQADVRNFKIDAALWRRSAQCEDATKPDTQDYCDPLLKLYQERGAAARKTELEPEVARLRDELARLPRPEVATIEEAVIGGYWAWIMGLAVVFVATFGSVIFARATVETKATAPVNREENSQVAATVADRAPLSPAEQSDFGGDDIDAARQLGVGGKSGAGNWGNGGGRQTYSREMALLDLTRRLASGETVDAQDDLAAAWNVDKSTVSKWMKRWREDKRIPTAQRVGRRHRLMADT